MFNLLSAQFVMVEKMLAVVACLVLYNFVLGQSAPTFPNTFYAQYTYELVTEERTVHGKGYMASDGTSRRITSTTLDISDTGETLGTGLLKRFDVTPPTDYAYIVFPNGSMDCRAIKPNQTKLYEFWSWLKISQNVGAQTINGHTYDMWSFKYEDYALAAGTEGENITVPAIFITTMNHTMRYYFYTNFESGNIKPGVYNIPSACDTSGTRFYNISPYAFIETVIDLVYH